MNVEEVQLRKQLLETNFAHQIEQFQKETGMRVKFVDLRLQVRSINAKSEQLLVQLEVELP
jgi:hypothetical protein